VNGGSHAAAPKTSEVLMVPVTSLRLPPEFAARVEKGPRFILTIYALLTGGTFGWLWPK
jgi:hypothetical protein